MDPAATSAIPASASEAATTNSRAGYFRWVICALLLFGTTKNYMDRQVLGVLKTTLQHDLGWNEIDYGNLVFAFQAAYAVGMVAVGRLVDRLGTRLGYALAMVFWSLASMGHALGSSFTSFIVARSALGFGESGVFPASIKTVAEWFPEKRARPGDRNLQRRYQYRRNHHSSGCAVDHDSLGLALGIHRYWRPGICLARVLDDVVSQAGGASARLQGGAGLYPQ